MAEKICSQCGNVGKPKKETKGSILTELVLWLFFIIPGLCYSIWRLSSKHEVCRYCGNESLVPLDSPVGKKLLEEHKTPVSSEEHRNSSKGEIKGLFD